MNNDSIRTRNIHIHLPSLNLVLIVIYNKALNFRQAEHKLSSNDNIRTQNRQTFTEPKLSYNSNIH